MTNRIGDWYIVHVYSDEDGLNVNARQRITEEIRKEIKDAKISVTKFFASLDVTKSMIANRNDLIESFVKMAQLYLKKSASQEDIIQFGLFNMSRQLANTCSMFRSFLDHNDRYFSKRYGIDSDVYKELKFIRSDIYDNNLSYKIIYNIRNYIQHHDMPPLSISMRERATDEELVVRLDLQISSLMEDENFRKKFSGKLPTISKAMPLFNVLEEWHSGVSRLISHMNNLRVADVKSSAELLAGIREKYFIPSDGKIALNYMRKYDFKPTKLKINLDWIPEEKSKQILANDF